MSTKWLMTGLVAAGLIVSPMMMSKAHARDEAPRGVREGHGDGSREGRDVDEEREARYDDLPHDVKDVLDHERRDHKVSKVVFVKHNGQEFYRCTVEAPNVQREIRITREGKLLAEGELGVRPNHPLVVEAPRRPVLQETVVKFDDLAGDIKGSVGREAGPNKIGEVRKYVRDKEVFYQVWISNGDRTRVIQVDWRGNIMLDVDATPAGVKDVHYDILPGEAKTVIGREARSGKVIKVTQATSAKHGEVFTAEIEDTENSVRYVTVSEKGEVISEITPHSGRGDSVRGDTKHGDSGHGDSGHGDSRHPENERPSR